MLQQEIVGIILIGEWVGHDGLSAEIMVHRRSPARQNMIYRGKLPPYFTAVNLYIPARI